jgi:hypothetical protein
VGQGGREFWRKCHSCDLVGARGSDPGRTHLVEAIGADDGGELPSMVRGEASVSLDVVYLVGGLFRLPQLSGTRWLFLHVVRKDERHVGPDSYWSGSGGGLLVGVWFGPGWLRRFCPS